MNACVSGTLRTTSNTCHKTRSPKELEEGTLGIRVLFQFCFLILIAATAAAQTSYQGLTPGVSTRSDVERVFGQPVRSISNSLSEYTGKIYVQYGKNTAFADRID